MFVLQGGTYAFTAPMWGWLCDRVLDPRFATLIGAFLITAGFLFLGPVCATCQVGPQG
jgi:dipeptide/tripeptide permease